MENRKMRRPPSIGSQSIVGDRDSKASEASANSLLANLKRLFDFSQSKIPGLYQVTQKHFILEYCESDAIAYSKFHYSGSQFQAKFKEENTTLYGIQYCGFIEIIHSFGEVLKIYVPAFRSYDPAGASNLQYVSSKQFLPLIKLFSIEIRAAQLGVREKRMEKIKKCVESVCKTSESMQMIWNWAHLQVKLACYKKINPPLYYEFIMNKVLIEEFQISDRDDCKEYLEKCMKSSNVKLPSAYYKSILTHEKKLPFDLKVLYSEIDSKESKEEKANAMVMHFLPKMMPGLTCVKEGKNYGKLASDCDRLCKLYNANVHQNKCKVM